MRAAALLFLPCLLLHAAAAAAGGNGSCARSCGGLKLRYPFGFSPGCGGGTSTTTIRLGCDDRGTAWVGNKTLGLLLRNVTERALVVELRPDCSRPLDASLDALFSARSYAPSARNALVVSSCNASAAAAHAVTNCSIPPRNYVNGSSHCSSAAADSIRCVVPPPRGYNASAVRDHFLNRAEMRELGKACAGLVSAVSFSPGPPGPALLLGELELEWWVLGSCRCSTHANCTLLATPDEKQAFRCDCHDGFEGDGFADGAGCRKVPKCDTSKYLLGECGKTVQIALLMAGILFGAMVTGLTCLLYHLLKRRSASLRVKRSTKRLLSDASCAVVPFYSYREIERATNGFSEAQRLGTGAYGTVYAGRLSDGRLVAVKRIKQLGLDRVMNEVKLVSRVNHRGLVRLLGCCVEGGQQVLVYEFMPNGTLAEHLQRERGPAPMPWTVRLRVAAETARAIAYLHSGTHHRPPIYHRDVKSSNILLDHEYNSKVADFGLSRTGKLDSSSSSASHISTAPQGTPGYVDPQYHQNFHLSDRSDVYSFGVVLVEIITAMKAVDLARAPGEVNLAQLAVDRIGKGRVDDIVDPFLDLHRDAWTLTSVHKVAELAFRCLAYHSEMRPSMAEVADELEQIQISGWAPSADDASFMSTTSSLCSSAPSTRAAADRSWGTATGRSRLNTEAVNAVVAMQDTTAKGAAVESPVSVQERWFSSDRSSPSSNSLLGNSSVH